ncbi:hypothetical protein E2C01_085579 [Portunus trituberculatus]|uniref:Uncharacterized protein n=1 Tax=Portunus trituberculatus TaxID=210409 RepID=A0A5B7JE05_PORTR|nr:hypothetical protein [Portunus trituberculatus]
MAIDCTRVIEADMLVCGQSLAEVEEKVPPISPSNCYGLRSKSRHHNHELTRLPSPRTLTVVGWMKCLEWLGDDRIV